MYKSNLELIPTLFIVTIDYRRTVVALTALSLLIVSMAVIFSCYTFHNSRYTFKRLAAAIHFLSGNLVFEMLSQMCTTEMTTDIFTRSE